MRRYLIPVILLALCVRTQLAGQADSFIAMPAPERFYALFDWHYVQLGKDTVKADAYLPVLAKEFQDKGDEELEIFTHFIGYSERVRRAMQMNTQEVYAEAAAYAQSRKWHAFAAEMELLRFCHKFHREQFVPEVQEMIDKLHRQEELGWSSPYTREAAYLLVGAAFYYFSDYPSAVPYLRTAIGVGIPTTSAGYDQGNYNLLGLTYLKLQKYDSAIYFFQHSLNYVKIKKNEAWIGIISGNIGNAYYQLGDYEKAYPYLLTDFEKSVTNNVIGSAVNVSSILANVELRRGDIAKSEEYIRYAIANRDTTYNDGMVNFYRNLYDYSKYKEDYLQAIYYADSMQLYIIRKEQTNGKEMLDKARLQAQSDKYNRDVEKLEAARSRQVLFRNSLLIIFGLTALIIFLQMKRISYIRRHNKAKLDKAEADLHWFTQSLIEKNQQIQSIREELDQHLSQAPCLTPDRAQAISELTNSNILTEEDWKRFRHLFEEVHPGFLFRLKEKFNDLTPSELRLLALTRLHIAPKDMAEMLGISHDSIKKTRYRLSKKINLPEDSSLDELVAMV